MLKGCGPMWLSQLSDLDVVPRDADLQAVVSLRSGFWHESLREAPAEDIQEEHQKLLGPQNLS